jgi:hypothetical protein
MSLSETRSTDSPYFAEYVRLLHQLHALIRAGQGDGREADATRDAMDEHWRFLSPDEAIRARAVSADLNTVTKGTVSHAT